LPLILGLVVIIVCNVCNRYRASSSFFQGVLLQLLEADFSADELHIVRGVVMGFVVLYNDVTSKSSFCSVLFCYLDVGPIASVLTIGGIQRVTMMTAPLTTMKRSHIKTFTVPSAALLRIVTPTSDLKPKRYISNRAE